MSLPDRILPLCDLLLGAAHADKQLQDREREVVHELLAELTGAPATEELEARISAFDPSRFDLAATAAEFRRDPDEDRQRILHLVAAVHDADDELDLAEDEYLRSLAGALELPASALAGLTLDIEIEEMRDHLEKVRKGPPPPPLPKKPTDSVDVDVD
jgi:uncharacterized tellurite resistance protein B-like protein